MTIRSYFTAILMLFLLISSAQAFEKVGTTSFQYLKVMMSGRSTAMGGAYSAAVFGADAIFWNPAALTTVRRLDVEFSYMDYFFDISHSSAALAYTIPNLGTFGFHALLTDVGDIEETTVEALGFLPDNTYNPGLTGNTFSPSSMVFGISFARQLTDRFSFGLSAKLAREDLVAESASALVFDGGLIYDTGYRSVKIAATIRQFGPEVTFVEKSYPLPQTLSLGIAGYLVAPGNSLMGQSKHHRLLLAFDMVQPRDYDQQYNVGLEYEFNEILLLRGGYKINYDEEGLGLGIGMRLQGYRFDYSYNDYGTYLNDVHRFTFGVAIN